MCNPIIISLLPAYGNCGCARFYMDRKQNSCSHMLDMRCFELSAGPLVRIPTLMDEFFSLHALFANTDYILQGHPCVCFFFFPPRCLLSTPPDFLLEVLL